MDLWWTWWAKLAALDYEWWAKVVAPLVQVVAILVTAWFAILGLRAWRQQTLGKRRIEVAEEASKVILKVRDAFRSIRAPFLEVTREDTDAETARPGPDVDYYEREGKKYEARSKDKLPIFQSLEDSTYLVEIYFDDGAAEAMRALLMLRRRVIDSAQSYFDSRANNEREKKATRDQWRMETFDLRLSSAPNAFTLEIEQTVKRGIDALSPYLALKRPSWWPRLWRRRKR